MYQKPKAAVYKYNDQKDVDLENIVLPKHTALLMIDMQNDFCSKEGKFAKAGRDPSAIMDIIPACKSLLEAARKANVFVVHVQQTTLPGEQSDNGGWLAFKTRDGKSPTYATINSWGWKQVEALEPISDALNASSCEPVIPKFRPDAFLNTALDMILQANNIKTVLCCGCTTEGCVLATVMGAAFHNYYTCVAEDAVATSVNGAHERAMWLMKKRYIVRSVNTFINCWKNKCGGENL